MRGKDAFLVKLNSSGNMIWTRRYQHPVNSELNEVKNGPGNSIVLTGAIKPNVSNSSFFALNSDSMGIPIWSKSYGGATGNESYAIQETPDGGFIMTGYCDHLFDVLIVKTDALGNSGCSDSAISATIDTTQFPISSVIFSVFSVGSETTFTPTFFYDAQFTTICLDVGIQSEPEIYQLNIYPNPANDAFTIDNPRFNENYSVTILNSMGQVVQKHSHAEQESIIIDTGELASGLYQVIVAAENKMALNKILIQH